ncbi:DNA polymerase III subunit alpha [Candidatus Parcubacteria bacterium 4484_255]|nr:MAG: DNA polymerase III subunit alpha [Candidatus Parcubacteria bacterium 4484_255]
MSFVHLHVHSHYSLLDGLPKIDQLINEAKKQKMKAVALTDHGVMYGIIEFYQKAKAAGIKPIIGVEAYVAPNGILSKKAKIDEKPFHLVLLAKNKKGYKNLIKLTSIAHLQGFYYKPRIDKKILKQHSEGIIALSACVQGEIPRLIINNQIKKAEEVLQEYKKIFDKNFYLEVQDHPNIREQKIANKTIYKLAKKNKVPLVATNDVHYLKPEDAEIQDILLCVQTKKKKSDVNRLSMLKDDFSFRPEKKMKESFKEHPEAISNTQKIADECNVEIKFGENKLPFFPLPAGENVNQYLKQLCEKKISERYGKKTKEVSERLKKELSIIEKTGFAGYFLIVQDFVNWSKKNNIIVGPGRGSAAGSIVSYLLNITNIDPLKYELLFERFLNKDRINMPDIDLDFTDKRRDEVIQYIEKKYGQDHVSQIITFGTMAARVAVRDVGRVLNYPYTFCDKLAKSIPPGFTLDKALLQNRELKKIYSQDKKTQEIIRIARKLEGVIRHASKHACGLLITPSPLTEYVPVQYDTSGQEKTIISQYDMYAVENLGLLKMDILGLKNLTIIEKTLDIVKHIYEKKIVIDNIPLDDKKTFHIFQKAQTQGVFQMESAGFQKYLKKLKPTSFEDIIAMVALYRPGPMELIPDYIDRKHGLKQIKYLHPKLKPILKKTYGIAIYQEQVLQIVRDLAGFSFSEADVLRKAVGKKIAKLLQKQKEKFISGCIKNKISKKTAEKVFAFIEPFARYGFNRSHATCYAIIAYQTAYLKAHYPTEFVAALLCSDQNNIDKITTEIKSAEEMGIKILPPDVNESFKDFTVIGKNKIRFGLLAIKNVGQGISETIIKERKTNGNFQNLEDFLARIRSKDLNKKSLESLIKSGALDHFGERNQMLENIEILLNFAHKKQRDKKNGQTTLFSNVPNANRNNGLTLKKSKPSERRQKLLWEKELLGLFISEHPLKEYEEILKKYVKPINEIVSHPYQTQIKVVGIITKIKKILTSSKETMAFIKIEDPSGEIEIIVFPKTLKANNNFLEENKTISVTGKISHKDETLKIIAEKIKEVKKETLNALLLKKNKMI